MRKTITALGVSALLTGLLLSGCGKAPDAADAYKDESPQEIYTKGLTALKGKSYSETIKRFEALDVQYPYYPETQNAQLDLIYAYYMKEDYALATAMADHYVRMHPASRNIDYAYYMRGLSNYYQDVGLLERLFSLDLAKRDLAQIKKSYSDFNEVYTQFPTSQYAPGAHQYMVYLRNVLADHELHVGEYYYERQAYVAAADRGANLVAHYQGAPSVKEGLILMAKSYHALGLSTLTDDTLRVLHANYPGVSSDVNQLQVHLDSAT